MRGLSFFFNGQCYVVDVSLVEKVVRKMEVTPVPTASGGVVGIANIKGKVITILDLSELTIRERYAVPQKLVNVIVFKALANHSDQIGLVADRMGDLIVIDENKIAAPPFHEEEAFYIKGIIVIGEVVYRMIHIDAIINRFKTVNEYDTDVYQHADAISKEEQ